MHTRRNVFGESLETCSLHPRTGFTRSGACESGAIDPGSHTVCAQMTREFLAFTRSHGNDLTTPAPEYDFPGLRPGDRWCLSVYRWREALEAGCAPPVILKATHEAALAVVSFEVLRAHALDLS
jgi:hypothetical protein